MITTRDHAKKLIHAYYGAEFKFRILSTSVTFGVRSMVASLTGQPTLAWYSVAKGTDSAVKIGCVKDGGVDIDWEWTPPLDTDPKFYVTEKSHGITRYYKGYVDQFNRRWQTFTKDITQAETMTQERARTMAAALNDKHAEDAHWCVFGIKEVSRNGPNHTHTAGDQSAEATGAAHRA